MVQLIKKFKVFNRETITHGTSNAGYVTEHNNVSFDSWMVNFSGIMTGTAVNVREDAPFSLLGVPELAQAEEPLVRLDGILLRHLAAYTSGGYGQTLAPTATGNGYFGSFNLDFAKILPKTMVAASNKVFIRGNGGVLVDYAASGVTALASTLRASVIGTSRNPNSEHFRPNYSDFFEPITVNQTNQQRKIDFDRDSVFAGLFLMATNADGGPGSTQGRTDGLIREIKIEINRGDEGQTETLRYSWGQLREFARFQAGFTQADWLNAVGTVFIPFIDEANPKTGGRMLFRQGDSILLTLDTAATVEEQFTAVTAATGDGVRIARLDHDMIPARASMEAMVEGVAPRAQRAIQQGADPRELRRLIRANQAGLTGNGSGRRRRRPRLQRA